MKPIAIRKADLEAALTRLEPGVKAYCELQARLQCCNVTSDRDFQRRFGGFYRVRRNAEWRAAYFRILERAKRSPTSFEEALRQIYRATGRVEASFASKLVASVDPEQPVIDSIVLANLGLRLPVRTAPRRLERLAELHAQLAAAYAAYLARPEGRRLVTTFKRRYPGAEVSQVKVLDLVLWQIR